MSLLLISSLLSGGANILGIEIFHSHKNISFNIFYFFLGVSVSTSLKNGLFNYQLARAPLIIGVRRPDDETDGLLHRNGKFINNQFVPADKAVSIAVNEEKK